MNEIEVLIDQYRQRVAALFSELSEAKEEGDYQTHKRLNTKLSCYRTFITEMEVIQKYIADHAKQMALLFYEHEESVPTDIMDVNYDFFLSKYNPE